MKTYRLLSIAAAILLMSAFAFAQQGSVTGTVTSTGGDLIGNAMVSLNGHNSNNPMHPGHRFTTETNDAGEFSFDEVPAETYTIVAMKPHYRPDSQIIDVLDGLTTHVDLELELMFPDSGDNHHGEHRPDSVITTPVELSGTAIVETVVNPAGNERTAYFLDVDNDGSADYRLCFGPPWYEPNNGNTRPEDGDQITIAGGLFGSDEVDPPLVIVWALNGLPWRVPNHGHGGNGGGWHHDHNCDVEPIGIELSGVAQVLSRPDAPHGDLVLYLIDTDDDMAPNYILDFGGPDYDPGNGATRPEDGEEITIVGGWLDCPNADIDPVIVYEINGLLWRVPGDTIGLGATTEAAITAPVITASTYLTAANYPNPFNPETRIHFTTPISGQASLVVYDITGREVATLLNSNLSAGQYSVTWNGASAPSGIYFYRVSVGSQSITQRMLLLK